MIYKPKYIKNRRVYSSNTFCLEVVASQSQMIWVFFQVQNYPVQFSLVLQKKSCFIEFVDKSQYNCLCITITTYPNEKYCFPKYFCFFSSKLSNKMFFFFYQKNRNIWAKIYWKKYAFFHFTPTCGRFAILNLLLFWTYRGIGKALYKFWRGESPANRRKMAVKNGGFSILYI